MEGERERDGKKTASEEQSSGTNERARSKNQEATSVYRLTNS